MKLSKLEENIEKLKLLGLTDEMLEDAEKKGELVTVKWEEESSLPILIRIKKEG